MTRFLYDQTLWDEIRRRARSARKLTAVVAYIGRRPDRLIRWPRDSVLIADISEHTVRRGSSSAKGALRLLRRGVRIFHTDNLHAKVFLFDEIAIVSSANISQDSAESLREAGVLLTDGFSLRAINKYVRNLQRNAVQFDASILQQRARLEPKMYSARRVMQLERKFMLPSRVWILDAWWDDEETPRERIVKRQKGRLIADEGSIDAKVIDWYNACGRDLFRRAKDGDWFFEVWARSSRSPFGRLKGPYRTFGPADLGRRFGWRRYCLSAVPVQRKDRPFSSRTLTALLRLLGDRRTPERAADRPVSGAVLLTPRQRKQMEKVVRSLAQ